MQPPSQKDQMLSQNTFNNQDGLKVEEDDEEYETELWHLVTTAESAGLRKVKEEDWSEDIAAAARLTIDHLFGTGSRQPAVPPEDWLIEKRSNYFGAIKDYCKESVVRFSDSDSRSRFKVLVFQKQPIRANGM